MLIDYIASALISLHEFWVKDMMFSVDLLKQFLEDMEAYSNVSWEGGERERERERGGGGEGEIHCMCMYYVLFLPYIFKNAKEVLLWLIR